MEFRSIDPTSRAHIINCTFSLPLPSNFLEPLIDHSGNRSRARCRDQQEIVDRILDSVSIESVRRVIKAGYL